MVKQKFSNSSTTDPLVLVKEKIMNAVRLYGPGWANPPEAHAQSFDYESQIGGALVQWLCRLETQVMLRTFDSPRDGFWYYILNDMGGPWFNWLVNKIFTYEIQYKEHLATHYLPNVKIPEPYSEGQMKIWR